MRDEVQVQIEKIIQSPDFLLSFLANTMVPSGLKIQDFQEKAWITKGDKITLAGASWSVSVHSANITLFDNDVVVATANPVDGIVIKEGQDNDTYHPLFKGIILQLNLAAHRNPNRQFSLRPIFQKPER